VLCVCVHAHTTHMYIDLHEHPQHIPSTFYTIHFVDCCATVPFGPSCVVCVYMHTKITAELPLKVFHLSVMKNNIGNNNTFWCIFISRNDIRRDTFFSLLHLRKCSSELTFENVFKSKHFKKMTSKMIHPIRVPLQTQHFLFSTALAKTPSKCPDETSQKSATHFLSLLNSVASWILRNFTWAFLGCSTDTNTVPSSWSMMVYLVFFFFLQKSAVLRIHRERKEWLEQAQRIEEVCLISQLADFDFRFLKLILFVIFRIRRWAP